jgi:hypothetical protein
MGHIGVGAVICLGQEFSLGTPLQGRATFKSVKRQKPSPGDEFVLRSGGQRCRTERSTGAIIGGGPAARPTLASADPFVFGAEQRVASPAL